MNIKEFVNLKNKQKKLFTPGPASLLEENIFGLEPCFGRNDKNYDMVEKYVLKKIKSISGHSKIVRMQGSASLALEIATYNFLYGKVLVVLSGVYSQRLLRMSKSSKKIFPFIKNLKTVSWTEIDQINEKFDWIVSCVTETSMGIKIPVQRLFNLKKRCKAKLFLDATASIGLEKNHDLSDVCAFSSCKGLFGLTGASFISYNLKANNQVDSFYLDINSHINKMMTGPYHIIASLYKVLKKYKEFKYSVVENKKRFLKKFGEYSPHRLENQPLLCTHITKKIQTHDKKTILYKPRLNLIGSIICHIGEVHLKRKSKGEIINSLKLSYE